MYYTADRLQRRHAPRTDLFYVWHAQAIRGPVRGHLEINRGVWKYVSLEKDSCRRALVEQVPLYKCLLNGFCEREAHVW